MTSLADEPVDAEDSLSDIAVELAHAASITVMATAAKMASLRVMVGNSRAA
jgi:hypothetical protein